jgi:predicted ATPase
VASQGLNAYEDGVRLVELGALSHDDLVLPHLNSTFDLRAEEGRAPVQTLIDFLRHKRLLLVLDNCEHVVTSTAAAAEALVASCPGVTILATSREPLSVDGERVWRIPALAYPDSLAVSGHDLTDCDAVQLFIERAETVAPLQRDVQTMRCVVEICQRLDGIPLAIEMAAARLDVLSLDQIAQRLADRLLVLRGPVRATSARHKTLRQTIDWSYELLTGAEQVLFNRLAAFSGTFSLAAAEAICSDDAELRREDIVEVMSRLVAKSMVMSRRTTVGVRFVLLETLREYALEQLRRSEFEHDTRRRHADFFVGCAEDIAGQVERAQRATADACAEQEHTNLLAAIAWCSERPEHLHLGMRIATALRPFWDSRCYLKLAKQELLRVLRADDTTTPPIVRITALDAAGYFLFKLDERDAARVVFEQSLRLAEEHGDSWHIANAWYWLSVLASWQERASDSQAAAECSLAISRTNGFEQITADVLNHLGCLAFDHGELQRASAYCDESLEIFRRLDHEPGITRSLFSCAMLADAKLDCSRAGALYNEAVALARQTRHKGNEAFALTRLADVYASIGRRNSRDLYNEALAIGRDTGYTRIVALALIQLGGTLCDQGDYAEAERLLDDSRGLLTQLNAQTSLLAARRDLYTARAAYERGQYGQALRLCEPISQFKAFETTISLREIVWRQRGWISLAQGDQEGAKAAFQESSQLAEHSQLPLAVIGSHLGLGYVDLRESRTDSARHHFDLALSECDQHDSKRLLAEALLALGDIHLLEADTKSARRLCVRALDVARDLNSKKNLARALRSLGIIASNEHLPELAAQHLAIGTTLLKALDAEAPWFQSIGYEAAVSAVCADISDDVFQRLWEGNVFRSMDQIESLVRNGQFAQ